MTAKTSHLFDHRWINRRFRIAGFLGEGSMGTVYLVEKLSEATGERRYALKVFRKIDKEDIRSLRLKQRFLQEAQAASAVDHPNIVRILEYGLEERNLEFYILMEFIRGETLKNLIDQQDEIDYGRKVEIIRQIADALCSIHEKDICHRDIKPSNIIVDRHQFVKITDFGIARIPNSHITRRYELIGTPRYMSPEAFVTSRVDHRSDIFSLGIVSYEFFLGRHPFFSYNIDTIIESIRHGNPFNPERIDPNFPEELKSIIFKMLEKNPDDRYQSAAQISEDIQRFLDRRPSPAAPACLA